MSTFWTLYWLGFIGIPLFVFIASKISGKDSGFQRDTSHIWVYQRSGAKVKDATVRDVWEHNHPGEKWAQHQENQFLGCSIFLSIGFVAFLAWLAAEILFLPADRTGLRLFWQIGAPILGGLSGGAFYGIQTYITKYKSGFLMVLHILALVVMFTGVVGGLVLTFLKMDLPLSHHWIWLPAGATFLFLILGSVTSGAKKKKAGKGGDKLENWVYKVMEMAHHRWDLDNVKTIMAFAAYQVQKGEYDWEIRDQDFFKETQTLMLDLVQGRPISIQTDEIYRAREEVIKALQTFYFYSVDKIPQFQLHPRIKKALKK